MKQYRQTPEASPQAAPKAFSLIFVSRIAGDPRSPATSSAAQPMAHDHATVHEQLKFGGRENRTREIP
jgi:hypothetical protein